MAESSPQLKAALNLVRRLPPSDIKRNLQGIIELGAEFDPDLEETLLQDVDQPLVTARDPECGRDFLNCDFNRDMDSFRSPWTNKYIPPFPDGVSPMLMPSDELRKMEEALNIIFDGYREKYFEGGVSSVYCWDQASGFGIAVLFKKEGPQTMRRGMLEGRWESIHIVDVKEINSGKWFYKLTSTVMLSLSTGLGQNDAGHVAFSGCLTRRKQQEKQIDAQRDAQREAHVVHLGSMVQEIENKLCNEVDLIYFGKAQQVISEVRKTEVGLVGEALAHGLARANTDGLWGARTQ